jgi:thiol-disulfide isomerase/thioredoxin
MLGLLGHDPHHRVMMNRLSLTFCAILAVATPARADRVQVYSIQGFACESCEAMMAPHLERVKGIKSWSFDPATYEYTMTLADGVRDKGVLEAFERQGYRAIVGAGHGTVPARHEPEPYPDGADVALLSPNGEAVGPLDKLRVAQKFTVFDVYADWCGPCRAVDQYLREISGTRTDIAVRRLNVVSFESPLARELGRKLRSLPYVVVFDPAGKRVEINGADAARLSAALKVSR